MKKIILFIAIALIGLNSFGQLREKWIDADSINAEKIVLNGKELDNDTIDFAIRSDSSGFADTANYLISSEEIVNRTIYVASTGSDSGDGTIGSPFATLLKAAQDIKDRTINKTITISISGDATFAINDSFRYEIAKKVFINSHLLIEGTTQTTIESGFSVVALPNRLYAYTLTKGGLTVTEDQYFGMFMEDGNNDYPIAYNAAGSDNFEIEYVKSADATPTSIYENNVTLNNTGSSYTFDIDFGKNIGSWVSFEHMNIVSTINIVLASGATQKLFEHVHMDIRAIEIGDNTNEEEGVLVNVKFKNSFIGQATAGGGLFYIYEEAFPIFVRCLLYSANASSQGNFYIGSNIQTKFNNGNYLLGEGFATAFQSNGRSFINVSNNLKVKNYVNFCDLTGLQIFSDNEADYEFESITNLLKTTPIYGSKLTIPTLYGTPPTNIVNGVSSGYRLVDPRNDIAISVDGITDTIDFRVIEIDTSIIIHGKIETPFVAESYAALKTIDFSDNNFKTIDITGDLTINVSNLPEGISTLIINQDGTGRTITIGTGWGDFADYQPFLSTTANAKNIVQFINDGIDIVYSIMTKGN